MGDWTEEWQAALGACVAAESAHHAARRRAVQIIEGGDRPGYATAGTEIGKLIVESLERKARETYSPRGGVVRVDLERICMGMDADWVPREWDRGNNRDWVAVALCEGKVTVAELWSALEAEATGPAVQRAALEATAKTLVDTFDCSLEGEGIRRVKGRPVLWMYFETEKCSVGSGFTASYYGREAVRRLAVALDAMFAWAGRAGRPGDGLVSMIGWNTPLESRRRFVWPWMDVVVFKEKLEFHFDEKVAMDLSRFIGEFAGDRLREIRR